MHGHLNKQRDGVFPERRRRQFTELEHSYSFRSLIGIYAIENMYLEFSMKIRWRFI